jgi:hypothetical protein
MREKEQKRIGIYIVLINIILLLFLFTANDFNYMYLIIGIISSFIAIIFNYNFLLSYKNKYNLISLIINILITTGILLYIIYMWH